MANDSSEPLDPTERSVEEAAGNRILFGESKADKTLRAAREELASARLDGHRRTPPDRPDESGS